LASRLVAAADGILNPGAVGLKHDLREAAAAIREIECPTALLPRVFFELARIANDTTDVDTQRRLRRLVGDAP